ALICRSPLPTQFERNLQLAWIKCGSRFARLRIERVHIGDVKPIQHVEYVHNSVEREALAEIQAPADAEIRKDGVGTNAGIAAQISGYVAVDEARRLKEARGRILRCDGSMTAGVCAHPRR